jgi:hypothetical protein
MPNKFPATQPNLDPILAELASLRQFSGPPKDFWPRFLAAAVQLTQADQLVLLVRKPEQPWRKLLDAPPDLQPSRMLSVFAARLEEFGNLAAGDESVLALLEPAANRAAPNFVIAARLDLPGQGGDQCVLVGLLSESTEAAARDSLVRMRLAAQTPEAYQTNLSGRQARADAERFASVLDLTALFNAESHFIGMALAFCNGVAAKFNCDRVSLGWVTGGYVRLQAISRTEKFDRQMAAAKALEVAMEESLDQDDEIIWPAPEGSTVISRDHEKFSAEHKAGNLCSFPLRAGQKGVGVVTCERQTAPFSLTEVRQIRLACDLASPRLTELQQSDRWFGARMAAELREQCAKAIGPEHTWAKVLAATIVVLLALLFFLRVPYRVEGNFVLRSDEAAFLSSPFEGFIDEVLVRPGDVVKKGDPLLRLKTSELKLEESYALADLNRHQRDTEKFRAQKQLADMRISEAQAQQAASRLEIVRYRLEQATVRAPFAAVVIEGDLRERVGAPVKASDALFRIARIESLYAEAEINERDVHELLNKPSGEIALVSRPKLKFPVNIITVEPAAAPKNEANVFLVRCSLAQGAQPWWRPGMSGVCKFNIGSRPLIWILTHRTVDFLRLKLWW